MQKCAPTQTPETDHAALRAKYLLERDKRLRGEGQKQYLEAEGEFEEYYEADPYTPVVPRPPISQDIDVAILGGGLSGLITAARVKQAGVTGFRVIELGGDFGGAWYWNRYPGIQCDTDCYCYLPMLEEVGYIPKQKYSFGDEVFEHCQRIGKHFGLYDHAIFSTLIRSVVWDESIRRWRIGTNRGDDIRARFVVMCQGPFNRPKLPGIPGITDFRGHTFHTARWDYAYTGGDMSGGLDKLADKRVAVIGTGASGVQVVPHLARSARHLYVFQRTPSYIDERGDVPTDPEWVKTLEPGWQKERQRNFHTAAFEAFAPGQPDLVCDGWTEVSRNLAAHLDATDGWAALADPEKFMELREIQDYRAMQRLRDRVDTVVEDERTARALKPYYRFLCKRPCFNDAYLPTFNRPNVTLVDVSDTKGVERITENGIIAHGVEHEVDCVIFASGFEITTDLDRRFGIRPFAGRDGLSLYDHWAKGYRTLHGVMSHGFPNQFFTGFLQGGVTASTTAMFEQQAQHIAYIIKETLARGASTVEPTEEAQDQWCATVRETAVDNTNFQRECTPGYYNNEGEQQIRSHLGEPYWPGFYALEDLLQAWRDTGEMRGLVLND
ncbi:MULTISPECIES: NAD(P)/FAD-dependent oxidoreductase [unclassified Streptomyces]|uniref:flavin-containing monooxygenase n=1 Tax=unclassified Streptomyces TaxID=2593676 RepID=UPI0011655E4F|nr:MULTISPECIES: NAD(P)/FAD-dependent oxidoreductase [unclassified Streptomyces]NMI56224.1 NAD(P)/FAD-dependent oxidoreductase [Streptomyces sp. RLA2-12]QDN55660.1 NAD(P)/FAD-dependent oxidoreductase [Streptomyces sp. S1D4-20]QDN65838.1 NAD(P)/FAD-dependent oxidoreductase [Streptomyces sp. S1D4-14]QDO48244.1 NAD(P)/FAD-dependent oxidoreductase [Streptomyces sp. RLB3-5]QDO58485.1 NAD(P)/FAD-dependent oxidoreductase [Streptomyces sp. RLB1-8]